MPFKIRPAGNEFEVYNPKTGESKGKSKTMKMAMAHMSALYAHSQDATKELQGVAIITKDAKGQYRWVGFSSNAYRDLENEIVSTKALEQDVDASDQSGDYGPLRWWHVPGADIGNCDWRGVVGRVLVESGTFKDEKIGAALKEASGDGFQMSIGFKHPPSEPDGNKIFHNIRVFERSVLPAGRAANPFTKFFLKERDMASIKEKIKALGELLKDDKLVDQILAQAESVQKEADESKTAYKEAEDTEFDWESMSVKAKKKTAPPADDEADEDPEEEAAETPEEEDAEDEEEVAAGKPEKGVNPFAKKKAKDEPPADEPAAEEAAPEATAGAGAADYLGDMTVKEFGDLMADILEQVLGAAPAVETPAPAVEAPPVPDAAKKELMDNSLKELQTLHAAIQALQTQVDELTGSQPVATKAKKTGKGFSASTAAETVVPENSPLRSKEASPHADPEFFGFLLGDQSAGQ